MLLICAAPTVTFFSGVHNAPKGPLVCPGGQEGRPQTDPHGPTEYPGKQGGS